MSDRGEFMTVGDLAKLADVVPATVRVWIDRGLVPSVRTAHGVRLVRREDGEKHLRQRASETKKGTGKG